MNLKPVNTILISFHFKKGILVKSIPFLVPDLYKDSFFITLFFYYFLFFIKTRQAIDNAVIHITTFSVSPVFAGFLFESSLFLS